MYVEGVDYPSSKCKVVQILTIRRNKLCDDDDDDEDDSNNHDCSSCESLTWFSTDFNCALRTLSSHLRMGRRCVAEEV